MAGHQIQDLSQQHGAGWMVSQAETPQGSRHPMAWKPEDFVDANSSVVVVDQAGCIEVTQALAQFKGNTDLIRPQCVLIRPPCVLDKSQLNHIDSAWTRWRRRQSG